MVNGIFKLIKIQILLDGCMENNLIKYIKIIDQDHQIRDKEFGPEIVKLNIINYKNKLIKSFKFIYPWYPM